MELELHPEEALDRALTGKLDELPPAEQEALNRHLHDCRACVAHLALARASRAADAPRPWDSQLNRHAIDFALDRLGRRPWWCFSPRLGHRRWLVLASGTLLALGGMASAGWWYAREPASRTAPSSTQSPRRQAAPASPRLAMAQPEAPLPPPADPSDDRQVVPRTARAQPSAAMLFEQASALRGRNMPDEAIAVFHRLQQLFPRSRETRISFAVTGRMLLDRGRSAQALAQFDQHLAQGGEASEEALAGRATALGRLGRVAAERETWQRLLAEFPRSVYAKQAHERLSELGPSQAGLPGASL
jgi:tetratricopeptide (TPR) repeat protein